MARLSSQKRQEQIIELLNNNGSMKVTELANYFSVSRETIRRDLNILSEEGSIKKGFGGALAANDFTTLPIDSRLQERHHEKMRIAQEALSYIPDHGIIYLDTGSTTLSLAMSMKHLSGYTVITNSISVVNTLIESNNRVIFLGGECDPEIMGTSGTQTSAPLRTLRIDVAFLGTTGFEHHNGPSTNSFSDAQVKACAIACAQNSIVLSDSRKSGYSSFTQYATWEDIDYLITDSNLPDTTRSKLSDLTTVVTV